MQLELNRELEAVGKEKNVDKSQLIVVLREAVLTAAKRYYGDCIFETKFNEETEEIELWRYRVVVEGNKVTNPLREISSAEALQMDDTLQIGDEVGEALPTEALGRIAAQSAKQVIVQKMMEAEKDKIIKDFREKKNQLVTGIVRRLDKQDVIVDLGTCEGLLPSREQIPGERFKLKDKILCYVLDVKKSSRGPQVVLSRAHPEFLVRLFEQEVAEIADGVVVIQAAVRDPGSRSKIAVYSTEPTVDPQGACIGMKGARVQAIGNELKGEKIDVIAYDRDPARFVCNALAPADVAKVIINERLHLMEVVVPDDSLSLAIGRRGQNVRLAAQLTNWKVDIVSESKMKELMQEHRNVLAQIPLLGEMRAEILVNEGYKDPADVARMDSKSLLRLLRFTEEEAAQVISGAAELASRIQISKMASQEEDALAELGLNMDEVVPERDDEQKALDTLDNIAQKTRPKPLQDPEKIDVKSVSTDRLHYWMKVRTVGIHTAAVLQCSGIESLEELATLSVDEIAYKTGLSLKYAGKINAESAKVV
jgi:N utilization substance protein A